MTGTGAHAPIGNYYGPDYPPWDCFLINRTGAATIYGNLVMCDIGMTQTTETTTYDQGAVTSIFYNVVIPADAGLSAAALFLRQHAPMALALEAVADNVRFKGRLRGVFKGARVANSGTSAIAFPGCKVVSADTVSTLDTLAGTPGANRIMGWLLQSRSALAPAESSDVMFDGVSGAFR